MLKFFIYHIKGEFVNYFIFLGTSVTLVCILALICWAINSSSRRLGKNLPYECGCDSLSTGSDRIEVSFYCIIILFILFEMEFLLVLPLIFNLEILNLFHISYGSFMIFYICMILPFFYEISRGAVSFFNKLLVIIVLVSILFLRVDFREKSNGLSNFRNFSSQNNKNNSQSRIKSWVTGNFISSFSTWFFDKMSNNKFLKKLAINLIKLILWFENRILARIVYNVLSFYSAFIFTFLFIVNYIIVLLQIFIGSLILLWLGSPLSSDGEELDFIEAAKEVGRDYISSFKLAKPTDDKDLPDWWNKGDDYWKDPHGPRPYRPGDLPGSGEGFGSETVQVYAKGPGGGGDVWSVLNSGEPWWVIYRNLKELILYYLNIHAEAIMWNSYQLCLKWVIFCVFVEVIKHWCFRTYYGRQYDQYRRFYPRKNRAIRLAEHEAFVKKCLEILKEMEEAKKKGRPPRWPWQGVLISPEKYMWYNKHAADYPKIKPKKRKHWPWHCAGVVLKQLILFTFVSMFFHSVINGFQLCVNEIQINFVDTQLGCCFLFLGANCNWVTSCYLLWNRISTKKSNTNQKVVKNNVEFPSEFNWVIIIWLLLFRITYTWMLYETMPYVFLDPLQLVLCGCPSECFDISYYELNNKETIKHLYPERYETLTSCAKALDGACRRKFLDVRYGWFISSYWLKIWVPGKHRDSYYWLQLRNAEEFDVETIWEESVRLLERDTQVAWTIYS